MLKAILFGMNRSNRFLLLKAFVFLAVSVASPLDVLASSAKSLLVGSWNCKAEEDGIVVESSTTYSRNGTFYGSASLEFKAPDIDFDVLYLMSGLGKWRMLPGNILESSMKLNLKNVTSVPNASPERQAQIRLELDEIIDPQALVELASQGVYEQVKFVGENRFLSIIEGDRDWSKAETCVRN